MASNRREGAQAAIGAECAEKLPRQYIIENGAENNRWLYKIERAGRNRNGERTCFYGPHIMDALVFKKKAEAVAFARNEHAEATAGALPGRTCLDADISRRALGKAH